MATKPNVARLYSCFATGADSTVALIEVSISPGIPSFSVIGLCDSSIRESQGRLISAFVSDKLGDRLLIRIGIAVEAVGILMMLIPFSL